MPSSINCRIVGNALWLSMHAVNGLVMLMSLRGKVVQTDRRLQELAFMQNRFLTVWNIFIQVAYLCVALACDLATVTNREHLLPKSVKKFRDLFFSSIVWPSTLLVFLGFWPFFLYDRELIFPEFIDKVFSFKSNLVMHLAIFPVVLWELAFEPRTEPASHKLNLTIGAAYYIIYNIYITMTYYDTGIWPYPLMYKVFGTILYPVLQTYVIALGTFSYYLQWYLLPLFWKEKTKNE